MAWAAWAAAAAKAAAAMKELLKKGEAAQRFRPKVGLKMLSIEKGRGFSECKPWGRGKKG